MFLSVLQINIFKYQVLLVMLILGPLLKLAIVWLTKLF
jgi:hypothetical protein